VSVEGKLSAEESAALYEELRRSPCAMFHLPSESEIPLGGGLASLGVRIAILWLRAYAAYCPLCGRFLK
jgi:hypothetical protein